MDSDTEPEDDDRNVARRVDSQATVIDLDDDEAPLLRGFRPPSVLAGPTHESHSDTHTTRPSEVNVEVVVEEGPRLAPQEEFSQVENIQAVRLGRRLVLVPQSTGTPRSVQDRSQFSSPVDEPTVGTHVARESFAIGSDTDSLTEAAEQVDQSEGSDDGRPVSEVDDGFGPHEELLVEDEVPPVRPSVAVMRVGFVQLDSWDLRDLFRQRGCLLVCATISLGIVPNLSENCFGGDSRRGKKKERAPARARVEAALIAAKDDVAQTATWGFDGQGQVGGQVRRFRSWKVARLDFGKRQVFYRRSGGEETPPKERVPQHHGEAGGTGVEIDPSGRVVRRTPRFGRR